MTEGSETEMVAYLAKRIARFNEVEYVFVNKKRVDVYGPNWKTVVDRRLEYEVDVIADAISAKDWDRIIDVEVEMEHKFPNFFFTYSLYELEGEDPREVYEPEGRLVYRRDKHKMLPWDEGSGPVYATTCSACGAVVPEDADACPRCGEPFEDEEVEYVLECSECGRVVSPSDVRCPHCGEPFEDEEAPPPEHQGLGEDGPGVEGAADGSGEGPGSELDDGVGGEEEAPPAEGGDLAPGPETPDDPHSEPSREPAGDGEYPSSSTAKHPKPVKKAKAVKRRG